MLIEIKIADGLAGIGRFLGAFHRFLKLLLEQVGAILLRLDGLTKNRFLAAILLAHRAGGIFKVRESFRRCRGGMRDHRLRAWVHFQDGIAARAGDFKRI